MSVNKNQLVDSVALAADLPKAQVAQTLDLIIETITQSLVQEEQVALIGFGTFTAKKRAARVGRDPRTGNPLQIPESNVAGFKSGKGLKEALNGVKVAQ